MAEKKFKSGLEYRLQEFYNYFLNPIDLEKNDRISGAVGWAALVALIVAYDLYAIKSKKIETLTRSFWRLSESKATKLPVFLAWSTLTLHLMAEKNIRRKLNK